MSRNAGYHGDGIGSAQRHVKHAAIRRKSQTVRSATFIVASSRKGRFIWCADNRTLKERVCAYGNDFDQVAVVLGHIEIALGAIENGFQWVTGGLNARYEGWCRRSRETHHIDFAVTRGANVSHVIAKNGNPERIFTTGNPAVGRVEFARTQIHRALDRSRDTVTADRKERNRVVLIIRRDQDGAIRSRGQTTS